MRDATVDVPVSTFKTIIASDHNKNLRMLSPAFPRAESCSSISFLRDFFAAVKMHKQTETTRLKQQVNRSITFENVRLPVKILNRE